MPAGLSTTRTSPSSWTMTSASGSASSSSGGAGGTSSAIVSPPCRRYEALCNVPSTRTCPVSISAWIFARDSAGTASASQRSSLAPVADRSAVRYVAVTSEAYPMVSARAREQAGGEQHHADRDRGVGDVERPPVPCPIVDVDEVHDTPEASAVDEVAHGAAEDQADRNAVHPGARGEHPDGHTRQHQQRTGGQHHHQPPPPDGQAAQTAEGEPGVHHEREREDAVDDTHGHTEDQVLEHDGLGDLIEDDDDRRDREDRGHAPARITGRQRSQRVGWSGLSPTCVLYFQQRSHLRPGARPTPMTRPGISPLSEGGRRRSAGARANNRTSDTMKSVGRRSALAESSAGRSSGAPVIQTEASRPLPIFFCARAVSSALATSRRTSSRRSHSSLSPSSSHSTGTSGKRSRCTDSACAPGTWRHASSVVNDRTGAIRRTRAPSTS